MAHNPDQASAPDSNPRPERRPRSTWIVIGILALLLGVFAFQGAIGIAVWFVLAGFLLLLTALYALIFRRRTWVSLLTGKQRKIALAGSALMVVLGLIGVGIAAPREGQQPTADDEPTRPSGSPSPSPSPSSRTSSPTPTGTTPPPEPSIANQPCTAVEQARNQGDVEYRCTLNTDGQLVWLDEESSERVNEARRTAEQKAAEERAAAEEAAAEAQQRAEQKAAEERAAAEQAAAEEQQRVDQERRAAQEEADRLAAEQEAERQRQAEADAQRQAEEAQRQAEQERRLAEEQAAETERQRVADAEAERQAEEARRLAEEQSRQQPVPPAEPFYYGNCTDVKAAGAAPIHRGDYGWHAELDADNDGVACGGD